MAQAVLLSLVALPAAFALVREDGVGRLPALGWNSWVGRIASL
jgi:alpha-galactosidase